MKQFDCYFRFTFKDFYQFFDEHLTFQYQIQLVNAKLKRANNLLAISRHHVPKSLLLQLYYGQFYSHLTYGSIIWGQNLNENSQTFILQKKAICLISFAKYDAHTNPLFKELGLLKLMDIIKMNNALFVHNVLNENIPNFFKNYFSVKTICHDYQTINNPDSLCSIPHGSVSLPDTSERSIKYICAKSWNYYIKILTSNQFKKNKVLAEKYNDTSYLKMNQNWVKKYKIYKIKKVIKELSINQY